MYIHIESAFNTYMYVYIQGCENRNDQGQIAFSFSGNPLGIYVKPDGQLVEPVQPGVDRHIVS
jgi:hypothetical protein